MTAAAQEVAERAPGFAPELGLMLGSGLGDLADLERVRRTTTLAELLPLSFGPEHLAA